MHITSKGQVTIPQTIRETMGFLPHTEVEFAVDDQQQVILYKKDASHRRGSTIANQLRGKGDIQMSTDEIMALTRGDDA